MGLKARIEQARARARIRRIVARKAAELEVRAAIRKSEDGGLLVHVALEQAV